MASPKITVHLESTVTVSPVREECARECRGGCSFQVDFHDLATDGIFEVPINGALSTVRTLTFSIDSTPDSGTQNIVSVEISVDDTGFLYRLPASSGYLPLVANPNSIIKIVKKVGAENDSRVGKFLLLNYDVSPVVATAGQSAVPNPLPVTGPLTAADLAAAEPISVTIAASVPVTGPLTDAELAARLPLGVTGPLTDAQLAARLPLSVTGPLTATQLASAEPLGANVTQQAGVTLSAPIADAPAGTETAPVVRSITRKQTTIETKTPLGAGATFTGPWHDSELDGTIFVIATSRADQVGASAGFFLEESDDSTNNNFTRAIFTRGGSPANSTNRIGGRITARYWRVRYVNGATGQGSFELTSCAMNFSSFNTSGNPGDTPEALTPTVHFDNTSLPVSNIGNSIPATAIENFGSFNTLQSSSGSNLPLGNMLWKYGGAFSGTADTARQGFSKARTPTVFRHLDTTAVGPTVVWTPGAGNKFRLLKVKISIANHSTQAIGGVLQVTLYDGATILPIEAHVFVPAAAISSAVGSYDFEFDLGTFGILSATANNALNVTLSAALTAGNCQVMIGGTEE